ncbi:hypothetical protein PybrP1_010474 [[Pythium] brassicae (nom. inval.)]|nr:hypothetical protein PybrP1_010474 [[Pythium] brassicae (nom. inval.)]
MSSTLEEVVATPRYTKAQVDNCAFAAWYPSFERVAVKGAVIPLPPAVVRMLLSDGVALPTAYKDQAKSGGDALADVRAAVDAALVRFGGRVFPKLNWTSPRDASWMLGSMQCSNFEDVMLLLQSSDFAVHDMTAAYAGCVDAVVATTTAVTPSEAAVTPTKRPNGPEDVYLVLKKWCNLYDSMLFRCFVVNHTLVGISQRNCDEFYPFLFAKQDHLCELIYAFFETHFRESSAGSRTMKRRRSKFPDADYIFDVYVDKKYRVFLLDFNVFGAVTDPLMFSWDELMELRAASGRSSERAGSDGEDDDDDVQDVVDFRIVESELSIRPNPLSGYRVPTDLVDHLAGGAGFEAFMEQVKRDNAVANDSESSDDTEQEHGADDDEDDGVLWGSDNDD